jgi:hypothetical protein
MLMMKPLGKRPLPRIRKKWEDTIKEDIGEWIVGM